MRRFFLAVLFVSILVAGLTTAGAGSGARWYKGNLHTHTLNSDGDSSPLAVATWYREHNYDFLVLSDHNYLTTVEGLNATVGAPGKFLLIPGEEVTDEVKQKPLHVNAYNLGRLVEPQGGPTMAAALERDVAAIRQAGALPSLNHPNFYWAVTLEDMLAAKDLRHFEVYNGHPSVNNAGGGGSLSLEQMWDALLTAGRRIHGIAVDDAHNFKQFAKDLSNPGRGWVSVRAGALDAASITRALAEGDFYASTGPKLTNIHATGEEYAIDIQLDDQEKTTTVFIGSGGKVLATSFDARPRYRIRGNEGYVRARVDSSTGEHAWTQAHFIPAR